MRIKQVHARRWVQPVRRGYRLQCCKCGELHDMDVRIHNGRVQFRVYNRRPGKKGS